MDLLADRRPRLLHHAPAASARAGTGGRAASTRWGRCSSPAGLVVLVYSITEANDFGWASGETVGLFAGAAVLLAAFLTVEARVSDPLMPFSIFRTKTVSGANVAGFILGTALFAMFLMLTLYMQQVLGFSAMKTGVAYLATGGTAIFWVAVASQLVTRVGMKPVLVAGQALMTVGLLWFTQVDVGGSYVTDLLPGLLLIGIGMPFSFIPISIAALAGVKESEAGLASGLINTSQQIGGALGIAVISAVATSRTDDLMGTGPALPDALTSGFHAAFWVAAGVGVAGVIAALTLIRRDELEPMPEAIPAAA